MYTPALPLLCLLCLLLACEGESTRDDDGIDDTPPGNDMTLADMLSVPQRDMAKDLDQTTFARDMRVQAMPDASVKMDQGVGQDIESPPEPVPVMVALGDFGRTTISCDGGRSWVANSNLEEKGHKLVCGEVQSSLCYDAETTCSRTKADGTCDVQKNCDCDHHPATPMGLAWGQGWFIATLGWGQPGVVMRSRDGVDWEEVQEGKTHARVLHGQETFVMGSPKMNRSSDQGVTWTESDTYIEATNSKGHSTTHPRQGAYTPGHGGRFVFIMESGVSGMNGVTATAALYSKDRGATWEQASSWPEDQCGKQAKGLVEGKGTLIVTHASGDLCVSTDGAQTFSVVSTTAKHDVSGPIFDGALFHFWSKGTHHTSPDGMTWVDTPMTSPQPAVSAIAYNPQTRTFAGVKGGWKSWYETQRFLWSEDGTTWQELSESEATRSHRIRHIAFGWAPPRFVCPER